MKPALLILSALSFALLVACGGGGHSLTMSTGQAVPAAKGSVNIQTDSNGNTSIDLKVNDLPQPQNLAPPQGTYVVWVQAAGQQPQNEGELRIGSDQSGQLKTKTPLKVFDIFVTAEAGPTVTAPRGPEVLRTHVANG